MTPAQPIANWIDEAIASTPVFDLHTHLYPPNFAPLMLWGIDELLTYHYLIGESIRATAIPYDKFWAMNQKQQADFIWQAAFVERAPISEACRGVITVLRRLGLDLSNRNLDRYREYFRNTKPTDFVDTAFRLANVHTVVMTNDPLDRVEREIWLKNPQRDPPFQGRASHRSAAAGSAGVGQSLSVGI